MERGCRSTSYCPKHQRRLLTVLVCQTWAVCGFRVVVVENYHSTISALFLYSFFGYSIDFMTNFSVAIRTYNRAKYLPELLEKLRSQINTDNISWEIVIVDNNSTDNTANIIQQYQRDWKKNFPINYYFESKQGASFARQRAIKEAKAPLIGFLDDDNIPAPDWVASAYTFGQAYPQAGAYGSRIHGDFEVQPPENFERIAGFYQS